MAEVFDLLGDPIPENFGKRGRPPHIPTTGNRNRVILLLALGWDDGKIAGSLAITPPTLRKHYFRELRFRDEARSRVEARRVEALYLKAREGSVSAIKELGRLIDLAELNDGAAAFANRVRPPAPPREEKLGKKAQLDHDAKTAHEETGWASVLPLH